MPSPYKIEVHTHEYRRSHVIAPRGRGGWLFRIELLETVVGEICCHGTYQDAVKDAKDRARQIASQQNVPTGTLDLIVLP